MRAEPDLAAGVASIDPRPSGLAAPGARAAPVLERTVQLALAATVFAFAAGSTYVVPVLAVGRPLRWLFLAGLAVLALAYAVARGRARVSWAPGVLALLLPGLALVSLAWSVDGPATVRRGGAFLVLFGAAAALAHGTAGRKGAVEGMLVALVTGAAAVAVAGIVAVVAAPDSAIQPATFDYPARFRGFGENPNTAAMLLAVATPLAVHLLVTRPSRLERGVLALLLALFAGEIAASASRGAMISALLGTLVVAAASTLPTRRRAVLAGAALVAFVVVLGASRIPQAKQAQTGPPAARHAPNGYSRNADRPSGPRAKPTQRTLFTSSGRLEAWRGAIRQARERPIVGFGFGTEQDVFVDRYAAFDSELPENSYIGAALQLGLAGVLLLLALGAAPLVLLARRARRLDAVDRAVGGACAGGLAAGLVLGLTQSYLFFVGNIATVAVWTCAFLALAVADRSVR